MQRTIPSLVLVLCVRDEELFLAENLSYHAALGVSRAYVFLDRCTDRSRAIAQAFPWVEVIEQDRQPDERFVTAYQNRCLAQALHMARTEGIEWLLHLDADEFACGDRRPALVRQVTQRLRLGQPIPARHELLTTMLTQVAPETEMVVLQPREALPTPLAPHAPFWKLHYFQLRRAVPRALLDPTTGAIRQLTIPIGHDKGKSIVRTTADVQPLNPHRWVRAGHQSRSPETLVTEYCGFHYHFVIVNSQHWLAKHRKHSDDPPYWEKGTPVRFPKQSWKEASLTMTEAQAISYYDNWVVASPRLLPWLLLRGRVVYDPFVAAVLKNVNIPAAIQS